MTTNTEPLPTGTTDPAVDLTADLVPRPRVRPTLLHIVTEESEHPLPRRRPRERPVVVCSFHTPDAYYSDHADQLREQLTAQGLTHEVAQVEPGEGEDWADVTRRKLAFIRSAAIGHPDSLVLWMDVDCRITHLPDYVRDSTADVIGFQRSFRSPLHIGYQNRARFWEPCFWGINTASPAGRRLVEDAFALEQRSTLKATDDYFLEEAWRANAGSLTFQMLPASAVVRPGRASDPGAGPAFFVPGSSGNVKSFKDRVVQHERGRAGGTRRTLLRQAKRVERALPDGARRPLRRMVDTVGVTGALTDEAQAGLDTARTQAITTMLSAGMSGDVATYEAVRSDFANRYVATRTEAGTREVAASFLEYAVRGPGPTVALAWWAKPYPGNFGDWISPMAVAHVSDVNIRLQPVTRATTAAHLVGLGSIGRFIRPSSVVVGTGISSDDVQLAPSAHYVSVRGPLTAAALRRSGGPRVEAFGDPGVLLSRIIPIERGRTNGRLALVRHHSHRDLPVTLPDHVDELSVLMSRREDIEAFLRTLAGYDAVITSAMHVMTACQSYGIPCGLVTFEGFEDRVHGTGLKYEDYALGAGVEVMMPVPVGLDLGSRDLDRLIGDIRVSEATKDEVEAHLRVAVARVQAAGTGTRRRRSR